MKPHEIIEEIVTNACAVHGLRWQDVIGATNSSKGKENVFETKFFITHMLYMYLSEDVAMELMNYTKPMIYYSTRRYYGIRHKYRDMERIIANKITINQQIKNAA